MVVAIDALQCFAAHAKEACGVPHRYAVLHKPSRRGVPQRVRAYLFKAGVPASGGKAFLDVL
jgi:hypothetical protein